MLLSYKGFRAAMTFGSFGSWKKLWQFRLQQLDMGLNEYTIPFVACCEFLGRIPPSILGGTTFKDTDNERDAFCF